MKHIYLILEFALIIGALYFFYDGLLNANGAPQQAVVGVFGCFILILARIAQAAYHNAK